MTITEVEAKEYIDLYFNTIRPIIMKEAAGNFGLNPDEIMYSFIPRFQKIINAASEAFGAGEEYALVSVEQPVNKYNISERQFYAIWHKVFSDLLQLDMSSAGVPSNSRVYSLVKQQVPTLDPANLCKITRCNGTKVDALPSVVVKRELERGRKEAQERLERQNAEYAIRAALEEAKASEIVGYQRRIAEYRQKQGVPEAVSSPATKVNVVTQQPTSVKPVEAAPVVLQPAIPSASEERLGQLIDVVSTIRRELSDLQQTHALLVAEKEDVTHIQSDIDELKKKRTAAISALYDAINPHSEKRQCV